jgi:hypothetical protein
MAHSLLIQQKFVFEYTQQSTAVPVPTGEVLTIRPQELIFLTKAPL